MDPAWPGSGPPPPHGPEEWIGGQQQQGYAGHAPPAHPHAFSSAPSASLPAAHPSAAGPAYLPAYSSYDVERILAASEQGQEAVQAGNHPAFLAGPSSSNHPLPFPPHYSTQPSFPPDQRSFSQRQAYPSLLQPHHVPPYHLPQPSHPTPFTSSYPNEPSYPSYPSAHSPYPSYAPPQPTQHPPAAQPRSWQKRRAAQYDDLADETRSSSALVPPQTGVGQPEWVQQLGQAQQRVPSGLPLPPPAGQAVLPPISAGFTPQLEPAVTAYQYPPGSLPYETLADNAGAGPPFTFSGDLPFPPSAGSLQPGPSSGYPTLGAVEPFQTHSRATTRGSTASTSSRSGSTASFSSATANVPNQSHLPPAVPPPPPPLHAQPEAAYDFAHYPLQPPSETTAHPPPDALLPPPSSHLPPSASLPPPPARQTPNSAYSSAPHPLLPAPSSSCQPPPALGPRLPPPNPANPVPTTSHTTSLSSASLSRPDSASAPAPAQPSDPAHAHFLTLASVRRLAHASLPPPLTYKPARSGAGLTAEEDAAQERLERRRREKEQLERGRVNLNQSGGVGSLDFVVRCAGGGGECELAIQSPYGKGKGRPLARVVLRGLSAGMVAAVEEEEGRREPPGQPVRAVRLGGAVVGGVDGPRCWACVGKKEGEEGVVRAGTPLSDSTAAGGGSASASSAPPPVVQGGRKRKAAARAREEGRAEGAVGSDKGYEDTLSAAIDRLELGGKRREKNKEEKSFSAAVEAGSEGEDDREWEGLLLVEEKKAEEGWKKEAMKCDVCSLTCGIGTFSTSSLVSSAAASSSSGSPPDFTVEIICARCDALFKCCSDCGGGGGRLTPGRWRSKELFPDGRKTCKLSHARNPALGEVTIDVLPLSPTPPSNLSSLENRCRQIYFNARLGTIARPEFLLRGDGLARSYDEVYKVTVDHWSLLSGLLGEQPDESTGVKHYLTLMYSTPRKRHAVRTDKDGEPVRKSSKKSKEPEKVAFGFAIAVADFSDGTLFFCCVMPWPINGQAFDAMTLLGESTTSRVMSDLRALNASRSSAGKEPFGRLTYNYLVSPFKLDSRANMGLSRRGYEPIDEVEKKDSELRRECFPPLKEVWLPKPYAAALQVYIRRLESEDDLGGPPADNAPRKRPRKSTTTTTAFVGSAAASTPSSTASPASVQPTDYSPFSTTSSLPLQAAGYAYPGMSPAFSSLPLDLPTPPYHPHPATPDMASFSSSTLYSPFNPSSPFFDPSSSSFIHPSHPPPPPS